MYSRAVRQRTWIWLVGMLVVATVAAILVLWPPPERRPLHETPLAIVPLAGGPELPDAEISAMAWYGDELVLVPQYPRRFGEGGGSIFVAERRAAEAVADGASEPLRVRSVPLEAPGLEERVAGFDGYEAIAFAGSDVYVAIETRPHRDRPIVGYLLRGRAEGRPLERVVLDVASRAPLRAQTDIANTGYETVVVHGQRVIAIYEVNGEINPAPRALVFDRALAPLGEVPMAPIEYRITDATDVDEEGRFWVANYHWPGSPWQPGVCPITERHGRGESHQRCNTVERLVELRSTPRGIEQTERAPILFELVDDEHARNWEGLVRLGERGFLVVTDEHPSTLFAFVARP